MLRFRSLLSCAGVAVAVAALMLLVAQAAFADADHVRCRRWGCDAKATHTKTVIRGLTHEKERRDKKPSGHSERKTKPQVSRSEPNTKRGNEKSETSVSLKRNSRSASMSKIEDGISTYKQQMASRSVCLTSPAHAERCAFPNPPNIQRPTGTIKIQPVVARNAPRKSKKKTGNVSGIVLTGEQVAYMAFARLRLDALAPAVGPSQHVNKWGMVAVGYPLWLWGEGDLNPRAVSDSVGGLFVSLDPHVTKIVFHMGDGSSVTCAGGGEKWSSAVPAGAKSPNCGYTYDKPSLPQGDYTVTATTYWAVDWRVNGERGTIPLVQVASTQLPVGELQVLVH